MRQSLTKLPLHTVFRSRIAAISGFGFVVFQLPPLFALGKVKLSSLLMNAGTTSKMMPSLNGTITTWPSAPTLVVEYVLEIEFLTACKRAD